MYYSHDRLKSSYIYLIFYRYSRFMELGERDVVNHLGGIRMLNKKHIRVFALIFVLVGLLLFAASPVLAASAAAPVFQEEPPVEPPVDPVPPPADDPAIPETGQQQQPAADTSWLVWLVIGIVIIILLVALLARGREPRV
jgi:hypothetical protein